MFNVTHCEYVLIFSPCILLAYDLCPQHFLSVGQLLSDWTSRQQCRVNDKSTSPNMQSTHILLFGSKFHIIFSNVCANAGYIYRKNRKYRKKMDIFDIFEKISRHFPTLVLIRRKQSQCAVVSYLPNRKVFS